MRLSSTIRTLKSNLRRGFTIVELLVAAALSMFIMAIITTAFSKGIDTFRTVRAAGNLQEKLRMASVVIKRDLAAQHFDGSYHPGLSGAFLTDQRLDQVGWTPPARATSTSTTAVPASGKGRMGTAFGLLVPSIIRWG